MDIEDIVDDNDGMSQLQNYTISVEVPVPRRIYEEAQQASEFSMSIDGDDSVRDHLYDWIEVSPIFVVDDEPIDEL